MIQYIIGGFMIFVLLLLFLGDHIVWVILAVVLFIVIRFLADIFWTGKDEGWW